LDLVHDQVQSRYQGVDECLSLFVAGLSQGGASTLVSHLRYQASAQLQRQFNLKLSVASAGQYSADVFRSSVLQPYSGYTADPSIQASFATDLLPVSRKMQNILLCHLLYTYKNANGTSNADIEYAAGFEVDEDSAGDDWSQMEAMIALILPDDQIVSTNPLGVLGYQEAPAFLTDASWAKLVDTNSSLYSGIVTYLEENSLITALASELQSNNITADVFYACNDLNHVLHVGVDVYH
jgi:hypothetical protein